jgi:hypothetical protein
MKTSKPISRKNWHEPPKGQVRAYALLLRSPEFRRVETDEEDKPTNDF